MAFVQLDEKTNEALRKIFIGGLNRSTSDDTLEKHFSTYGVLVDSVVIKDPNTKTSRGFGFATYKTIEDADACVADKSHVIDGKTLDVKRAIPRDVQVPDIKNKKIFLGGIPTNVTDNELKDMFESCLLNVKVAEVSIIKDKDKQESKGFGFITFEDEDHVAKVATTHYFYINGKKVEARSAQPKGGQQGGDQGGGGGRGGRGGRGGGRGMRGGRGGSRGGGYSNDGGGWNQGNGYQSGWDNSGGYGNGYNNGYNQGGYDQSSYYQGNYNYSDYGGGAGSGYWDQDQGGGQGGYGGYNSGGGGGTRGAGRRGGGGNRYTPY